MEHRKIHPDIAKFDGSFARFHEIEVTGREVRRCESEKVKGIKRLETKRRAATPQ
jgi:hypothetical protein